MEEGGRVRALAALQPVDGCPVLPPCMAAPMHPTHHPPTLLQVLVSRVQVRPQRLQAGVPRPHHLGGGGVQALGGGARGARRHRARVLAAPPKVEAQQLGAGVGAEGGHEAQEGVVAGLLRERVQQKAAEGWQESVAGPGSGVSCWMHRCKLRWTGPEWASPEPSLLPCTTSHPATHLKQRLGSRSK